MNILILVPVFLPILAGALLLASSFRDHLAVSGTEIPTEDTGWVH
jgi:hypothetical protein